MSFDPRATILAPHAVLAWLGRALTGDIEPEHARSVGPQAWSAITATAIEHGVAPLLFRRLSDAQFLEEIPPAAATALGRAHFASAASNAIIYDELERILPLLVDDAGEAGANGVVVLKGADLAATLYPSIALRPMCDLDVLVRRSLVPRAISVLEGLGYRKSMADIRPGHEDVVGHAFTLVGGPGARISVEIHWSLVASDLDWRSPDLDWFWSQVELVPVDGGRGGARARLLSLPRLRPEAHFLYLAAHLVLQHGCGQARLVWLYDLHLLLSAYGTAWDWDAILSKAREFSWNSALRLALETTRQLFDTPMPIGRLEAIVPDRSPLVVRRLRMASEPSPEKIDRAWTQMMGLTWRGRVHFVWNHCFPQRSYLTWRYRPRPPWLWPLCYPYRWCVIGINLLRVIVKGARRFAGSFPEARGSIPRGVIRGWRRSASRHV